MATKNLAYQRVYQSLKEDILSSHYEIDTLLPTEAELETLHGVSRSTIRKAMELLAKDGYIDIKQGRGTMVKNFPAKQNYNHVTSVTESLKKRGCIVETKNLYIEKIKPNESIAKKLSLSSKEQIAHIQRVQTADGIPICIMENYIPYQLVPSIEAETQISSLYQFLESIYHFEIEHTKDRIYARTANFYEAQILCVPVGSALLFVDRICFDPNGCPICYDHVKILGSHYEIEIEGRGRKK